MAREQTSLLRDLFGMLRPARSMSPASADLLAEHEKALREAFPDGSPSGDGSDRFDELVDLRAEELRWQVMFRRRLQIVLLVGAVAWGAVGVAIAWERLAG